MHQGDPAGQEGDDGDQGYAHAEAPEPTGGAPGRAQLGVLFGERGVDELELECVGVLRVNRHPFLRGGQVGAAVQAGRVLAASLPGGGRFGEMAVPSPALPVVLEPGTRPWPFPQQRLVGHLDGGVIGGDQPAGDEHGQHRIGAGDAVQFGSGGAPADVIEPRARLGQP